MRLISEPFSPAEARARNHEVIRSLGERYIDTLREAIGGATRVAWLDFPNHGNVGDSAIWMGERAALRALGVEVVYVCEWESYRPPVLRRLIGDGPILLHGGGNFGDLWPWFHGNREWVLNEFRDNRIIQLPQSIHFEKEETIARTRATIEAHPDYTLLTRDAASFAVAQEQFQVPVTLCPDAAFCLGPSTRRGSPVHDVLILARDDHELRPESESVMRSLDAVVVDWMEDERTPSFRALAALAVAGRRAKMHRVVGPFMDRIYAGLGTQRVERGLRLVSQGSVVVTDRLHTHILCLLLGIPNLVLDNSYGKVRGCVDTWTADSPFAFPIDDPADVDESLAAARALAG